MSEEGRIRFMRNLSFSVLMLVGLLDGWTIGYFLASMQILARFHAGTVQ